MTGGLCCVSNATQHVPDSLVLATSATSVVHMYDFAKACKRDIVEHGERMGEIMLYISRLPPL